MAGISAPAVFASDSAPKADKTLQAEEDDYANTPFTEYGEFNEEAQEAADTRFFQYGRFFGFSAGLGFQQVAGNRGLLWQGGFPNLDFKVHYWFDFNAALDLNVYTAPHFYTYNKTQTEARMVHYGVDGKYYFDTKNLSAAISFANPYVLAGFGAYTKTETNPTESDVPDNDTGVGFCAGAGLEFALRHRKTYLELEGKMHFVNFKDTQSPRFSDITPNLTGSFFTLTASLLFTW